eukprot:jgi/Chlat1/3179/Chrsp22S03409
MSSSSASALPPSLSVPSLSSLSSLRDVGAMARMLGDALSRERAVEGDLEGLMGMRGALERRIRGIITSAEVLDLVKAEAEQMASSVGSTAALAERVSGKVRELDRAQGRVSECIARISTIVDRANCIEGARTALDAADYEQASNMLRLSCHRVKIVRSSFSAAAESRDHAAAVKYARLFGPLGLQQEGLSAYVGYLRAVVATHARDEFEALCDSLDRPSVVPSSPRPTFVGVLGNLFKDVVACVEDNEDMLRETFGNDAVLRAMVELQVCVVAGRGAQVVSRYIEERRMNALVKEITAKKGGKSETEQVDPRTVEGYLEEMLLLVQTTEEYTRFMLEKMREAPATTTSILPEFFLSENVAKAIRIDESAGAESLTSSMVDDVFFVLHKCGARAAATSSPQCAAAVLNFCNNTLANEFLAAVRRKIAANPPGSVGKLLGAQLSGSSGVSSMRVPATEFATALNNADVSAEYVVKLKQQLEDYCNEILIAAGDRERLKSCFSDLAETAGVLNGALEQMVFGSITVRLRPALDAIANCSYELKEEEYAEHDASDAWVQRLLATVDSALEPLQSLLTGSNYDATVHLVVDFTASRIEAVLMQRRFNQLGGLQLDRDMRALVGHFSALTQRSVRDKFARLTQIATVLNLEKVTEILDYWGENSGSMTWRLTAAEVRRVLSLRVDFKPEAISALKL